MSIAKPFTFVAGQKARANEVNADFDTLYSQVNINIADIAQINRDVDNIESTKADINGNSTQRFAVANPVNSTDAINKQTLNKSLTNVLDFINGLTIEKDSNSPEDTILVNPGSCYDSTKQVILKLSNITSKQNINQGANTTYYVYIIGNETGSSTDIIISNSSVEPTLPTGYTKFRGIGSFDTDSDNKISSINSYTNTNSKLEIINWAMPDYTKGISVTFPNNSNRYTVPSNGVYICTFGINETFNLDLYINDIVSGVRYSDMQDSGGLQRQSFYVVLNKNDIIRWNTNSNATSYIGKFFPLKGV